MHRIETRVAGLSIDNPVDGFIIWIVIRTAAVVALVACVSCAIVVVLS